MMPRTWTYSLLAYCSLLFVTGTAHAQSLYWVEGTPGSVQYADQAGGGTIQDLAEGLEGAFGIATIGDTVYWTEPVAGRIRRTWEGAAPELIAQRLTSESPRGIAIDANAMKVFWSDNGTQAIYRADLDGGNVEQIVTSGLVSPGHLALDPVNAKLYWMDNGTGAKKISRSNLDGSVPEDVVLDLGQGWGIALNVPNQLIYWIDGEADMILVGSVSGILPVVGGPLIDALSNPMRGLVTDVALGYLYWTETAGGSIKQAQMDGSGVASLYGDLSNPQGLALRWDSALPVQLSHFTASANRLNAELKWRTESEVENFGFTIERRMMDDGRGKSEVRSQRSEIRDQKSEANNSQFTIHDSQPWQIVGFVQGSGTSSSPRDYSFVDKPDQAGRYAYRIKQIDHSGTFAYTSSLEVSIGLAPLEFALSQNYPNPFNPTTTIEFTLPADGYVVLKVYDLTGREVATLVDDEMRAGVYQQVVFDASRLASGLYFARLQGAGKQQIRKMMLLR